MSDFVHTVSDFAVAIGILLGAIIQLLSWLTQRENAKRMAQLEKNTNSIKDALIRTTAESAHAKGVIAGRALEAADEKK